MLPSLTDGSQHVVVVGRYVSATRHCGNPSKLVRDTRSGWLGSEF